MEVRLPDGRLAWIQVGDVTTDLRPISLEASLELAKRFLGVTYTWGGTSSFGFDCSGYTQMIYRRRGILMPRDADDQAAWPGLVPVEHRTKLQPGDLLFFGKDLEHITHTGMSLGGDAFIHDTPKDRPGVQISSLSDPAWSKILVALRRPK
jgi:cell wall-associated NlpC family hydrolase